MRIEAVTRIWVRAGTPHVTVLLVCGVIQGPLFVTAVLVQGATRPDYNPLRHSISSLALGEFGWIQSLNFIVTGLVTLAFAVGVRRVLRSQLGSIWGALLIGVWAVCMIGAGIFATDPIGGYPPGTPERIEDRSLGGVLHNLFAGPAFAALTAAFFVFARWFAARGERGWALYSAASGPPSRFRLCSPAMDLAGPRDWASSAGCFSVARSSVAMVGSPRLPFACSL